MPAAAEIDGRSDFSVSAVEQAIGSGPRSISVVLADDNLIVRSGVQALPAKITAFDPFVLDPLDEVALP
jgi:hypothetical protein